MKATSEQDGIIPNSPHLLSEIMLGLIPLFYADRWERDLIDYNNGNELVLFKTGVGWLSV